MNTTFEIKLGSSYYKHDEYKPGRFPQWNKIRSDDAKLCKDVSFESDIMVNIYNRKKNMLDNNLFLGGIKGSPSDDLIGSFSVDINSVLERSLKP